MEKDLELRVPLAHPKPGGASVGVECGDKKVQLPEGDGVFDFGAPEDATGRALVRLEIPQEATLEREAFEARLTLTNPTALALEGIYLELRVRNSSGVDVTHLFYPVPPVLSGIGAIEGSSSLAAGATMACTWTLIPREGLGGESPGGRLYSVYALISYTQGGRLIQATTRDAHITVKPEPALYLYYFLPRNVKAGVPFKLGILIENRGFGTAHSLRIVSGLPRIVENRAGLAISFEMLDSSWGSSAPGTFTVEFGDIAPGEIRIGYWILRCDLPGTFTSFTAQMTHRAFRGVDIHPLVRQVRTEIIANEDMAPIEDDPADFYVLIDSDSDGFPDYLINLLSGNKVFYKVFFTVPDRVTVTHPYTE
ncbi:MAG: hypothetical protein L6427_12900 [Actinomycetia bacterium]|nr:hypothetical protein [Actinomycetes bacterium]